jgi:AraC family transcriptional regulator
VHTGGLDLEAVGRHLLENEFELIGDGKAELVEQIKIEIIELVRSGTVKDLPTNLSSYLSAKLDKDYHTLTLWFSELEQMTLTKYLSLQKIERVKELLEYGELKMGEIARQLGYSSIGHLSNQFKQVTGFSPSYYKKHIQHGRTPLDRLRATTDD